MPGITLQSGNPLPYLTHLPARFVSCCRVSRATLAGSCSKLTHPVGNAYDPPLPSLTRHNCVHIDSFTAHNDVDESVIQT